MVFVRKTKPRRIEILSVTELQKRKHSLQLMKEIIVYNQFIVVFLRSLEVHWKMIIRCEKSIAEGLCHEELLQHRVHVTDLTEITDS